jgi:type IV pilus assembly protein PilB
MSDRLADIRAQSLAEEHGYPFVRLRERALDADAIRTVPFEALERRIALPFAVSPDTLSVAFGEPSPAGVEELQRLSGRRVETALASRDEVTELLSELAAGGTLREDDLFLEGELLAEAPTVRAVNDILRRAVIARASDIHVIPETGLANVRMRIDGVVQEYGTLTGDEATSAVMRVKVLAKLDVAERRRPQDGRFTIRTTTGRVIDIRVTLLPTVSGEGLVMRLLEKTRNAPSLTDVGLERAMQMEIERIVDRGIGAFLVTGPTGSGKSTTLHGALADLARPDRTVITVEDPVEYELRGAYQMQLNTAGSAGATARAAALSVLPRAVRTRGQDPLSRARLPLVRRRAPRPDRRLPADDGGRPPAGAHCRRRSARDPCRRRGGGGRGAALDRRDEEGRGRSHLAGGAAPCRSSLTSASCARTSRSAWRRS